MLGTLILASCTLCHLITARNSELGEVIFIPILYGKNRPLENVSNTSHRVKDKTRILTQFHQPESKSKGSRKTAIIKKKGKEDSGKAAGRKMEVDHLYLLNSPHHWSL